MSCKVKGLQSNTIVLMVVIAFSKLIGMLRDVFLARYYGTSNVSDAYLIAISVPTLLFYFIGSGLSTAYLPVYNKIKNEKGSVQAKDYSNNLISCSMLISTVIVVILFFAPELIIKIFAAGFDEETIAITAKLIRISSVSIYFMVLVNVWSSFLHSENNFLIPGAVSIPRNIVIIISIYISTFLGLELLGIGITCAYFAEYFFVLPFVLISGYRPKLKLDLKSNDIRETIYLVGPIIIGIGVGQINKIIDKSIASSIVIGGISALNYASIINNAIQEVLVTGIITVLFAKCSAWVAEGKHDLVKDRLSRTIQIMLFILVPATFGVLACSDSIVTLILMRGKFNLKSLEMTSNALCCYTFGIAFLAVRDTLIKVFYAYKDTKTTTMTSIFAISVNIVLNILLSRFMGISGLALATSISAVLQCVILYIKLLKKIGEFGKNRHIMVLIKSTISSAIMFLFVAAINNYFFGNASVLSLLISVFVGSFSYLIISLLIHNEALDGIKSLINK